MSLAQNTRRAVGPELPSVPSDPVLSTVKTSGFIPDPHFGGMFPLPAGTAWDPLRFAVGAVPAGRSSGAAVLQGSWLVAPEQLRGVSCAPQGA